MDQRRPLTLERARELRSRQTTIERLLWQQLRNRKLCGYKFRRQAPIGPFIVDFLCIAACVVIELDGSTGIVVPSMEVSAVFSAEFTVRAYLYFTATHMLA